MHTINASTVSMALMQALHDIKRQTNAADTETSRNGEVLVFPTPVVTEYVNPTKRVLFSPMRNANPFFHMMEALWMLAGRNDLAWPRKFNSRFGEYSDDGEIIWGGYGWRWREFFGYDQLERIVQELVMRPDSRRAVLSMWNAMEVGEDDGTLPVPADINVAMKGGRDVPCNTHAYFDLRGGRLNMLVCCRSNDVLWGAYGANAVHFSILLEYMAAWLNVPVGTYRQMSNNLHIYTEVLKTMVPNAKNTRERLHWLALDVEDSDRYEAVNTIPPMSLVNTSMSIWDKDLALFMTTPESDPEQFVDPFFKRVAWPMHEAWTRYKAKDYTGAMFAAECIGSWDWRTACVQWLERRADARKAAYQKHLATVAKENRHG